MLVLFFRELAKEYVKGTTAVSMVQYGEERTPSSPPTFSWAAALNLMNPVERNDTKTVEQMSAYSRIQTNCTGGVVGPGGGGWCDWVGVVKL